jgi:putative oxidoreductase
MTAPTTRAPVPSRRIDIVLAILRVVVGLVFVAHGAQKLFVFGLAGVAGSFGQMGIPAADIVGPLVALLEFFGGLAILFGLLTRLAALGLAMNMLGAVLFVHFRNGFFLPSGFEFAFTLLGANIALLLAGAGRFSLDHLVASRRASSATA